jgi:hypothetical protein
LALSHCLVNHSQIDFRFPAAGDAVEEKGVKLSRANGQAYGRDRLFLVFRQKRRRAVDPIRHLFRGELAVRFFLDYFHEFMVFQLAQDR